MMAKCLECALLQCQLQNLLFISCHLHQSTHQMHQGLPATRRTCHLVGHQGSNATTSKDWPLLLANLMLESSNQHLVHHLLASNNQRPSNVTINGNSSPGPSCRVNESNCGEQKQVPANDSNKFNSMHKKEHSPINYCDSEGAIKNTSVESRVFPKLHLHRPNEQTKAHSSCPPAAALYPLPNSSSCPSKEKFHFFHLQKSSGDIKHPKEPQVFIFNSQDSSSPKSKRLKQMDLPDSTTSDSSQLTAKLIGGKLRKLAESFHSFHINPVTHDT